MPPRFLPVLKMLILAIVAFVFGPAREIAQADSQPATSPARRSIAFIINEKNAATDMTIDELKTIFTLDRQFWSNGKRIVVLLPAPKTPPFEKLLDKVYSKSEFELHKYWVGKLYEGKIPSIPTSMRSSAKAAAAVRKSPDAISAVLADEIIKGVRMLKIDGKSPADANYPFTVEH